MENPNPNHTPLNPNPNHRNSHSNHPNPNPVPVIVQGADGLIIYNRPVVTQPGDGSEWRVPDPPVHEIGSSDEEVNLFGQSPPGYPYGPVGEPVSLGLRRNKRVWKGVERHNNGQRVRYFPAKKKRRPRGGQDD